MYYATAAEMETLDALAVASGLHIRQMMELAGYHMVSLFTRLGVSHDINVAIVCGRGNKGGDGLSAARHLVNNGYTQTSVILADTLLKPDPAHHLNLLRNMEVPVFLYTEEAERSLNKIRQADLIIDALIGYHLEGAPRAQFAELVNDINEARGRVVSYDLPSGADATSGMCEGVCVQANETLTLALPKRLFLTARGRGRSGVLYLADIGIPAFLYDRIKKNSRPSFEGQDVLKIG